MEIFWQPMNQEEYAAFERGQADTIIKSGNIHWRRIRPFFYRPMLPFQEFSPDQMAFPRGAFFGGVQYAVKPGQTANSSLCFMLFEDTASYQLDSLDRSKKKQVRQAERLFSIQPILDLEQFKREAYPVYLSFYERTNYRYKAERRYPDKFGIWADSIFRFSKVVVIGAYRNGALEAIGITKLVENTLVYSTTFCTTEALELDVTSFMLHRLRETAARHPAVRQIYVGNYKFQGRKGIDEFYFSRGCKLVRKPAVIHLNPLLNGIVKRLMPVQYLKLVGKVEDPSID